MNEKSLFLYLNNIISEETIFEITTWDQNAIQRVNEIRKV